MYYTGIYVSYTYYICTTTPFIIRIAFNSSSWLHRVRVDKSLKSRARRELSLTHWCMTFVSYRLFYPPFIFVSPAQAFTQLGYLFIPLVYFTQLIYQPELLFSWPPFDFASFTLDDDDEEPSTLKSRDREEIPTTTNIRHCIIACEFRRLKIKIYYVGEERILKQREKL